MHLFGAPVRSAQNSAVRVVRVHAVNGNLHCATTVYPVAGLALFIRPIGAYQRRLLPLKASAEFGAGRRRAARRYMQLVRSSPTRHR